MSDFRSNCFCHWVWLPSPLQMISLSQACFFLPWGAWRHKWMPVHYCFQVIESSRRYYWRGQINSRTLVEAAHQKVFWKKGKWSSGKFKSFLCDPLLWEDFLFNPPSMSVFQSSLYINIYISKGPSVRSYLHKKDKKRTTKREHWNV